MVIIIKWEGRDRRLGKVMRNWHSATMGEYEDGGNVKNTEVRITENPGITCTLQCSANKEPRDLPQYWWNWCSKTK